MKRPLQFALALAAASVPILSQASSHREAPNIAGLPKVDGTDLYLFRSYEAGRQGFVTMLANYIPFRSPDSWAPRSPLMQRTATMWSARSLKSPTEARMSRSMRWGVGSWPDEFRRAISSATASA